MSTINNNTAQNATPPDYVITGDTLIGNEITELPMLVNPIFQKVGVVAIAGSSDTGKSSLLRDLALSIVTEKETFLSFPINAEHKSVLYISTEDDDLALSCLLKRQNTENLEPESFKKLRFIFDTYKLHKKIEDELNRHPVDLVIIDAFSDIFTRDMHRVNEVRTFIHWFSNLAYKHKCLVIILHHTSKRTEELPPSKNNVSGSQGFEAKMRVVIELRKDTENPSSRKRHFCIVKGNYLPEEYKNRSYVLNFTENMVFEMTSERVSFEELATPDNRRRNQAAFRRARELRDEGNTITRVHEIMQEDGFTQSRSTIGDWLRGR